SPGEAAALALSSSSNRLKVRPFAAPTLQDAFNIAPVATVQRHRLAERRLDPRPGKLDLRLAELLRQERRDHADVRLVQGEDVGQRSRASLGFALRQRDRLR